jgi:hypothetical protein
LGSVNWYNYFVESKRLYTMSIRGILAAFWFALWIECAWIEVRRFEKQIRVNTELRSSEYKKTPKRVGS